MEPSMGPSMLIYEHRWAHGWFHSCRQKCSFLPHKSLHGARGMIASTMWPIHAHNEHGWATWLFSKMSARAASNVGRSPNVCTRADASTKLEWLSGNIRFLQFRSSPDPEWPGKSLALYGPAHSQSAFCLAIPGPARTGTVSVCNAFSPNAPLFDDNG